MGPEGQRQLIEEQRQEQQRWIIRNLEEAVGAPVGAIAALIPGVMSDAQLDAVGSAFSTAEPLTAEQRAAVGAEALGNLLNVLESEQPAVVPAAVSAPIDLIKIWARGIKCKVC